MSRCMRTFAIGSVVCALYGCIAAPPVQPIPEIRPGVLAGYLPREALPNSLALVPPPPAPGSAALAADEYVYRSTRSLRDGARWTLAARDAELQFPAAASAFSCAVGVTISEANTPRLYRLLRRTLADGGLSTYTAKNEYRRRRPFLEFKEQTCRPQDEARLEKDGSYPSGHSAIGWTWALVLAELAPERANEILQRGFAFGESRVICGVHWQSDVEAGRLVGAAAVARLHADAAFEADLEAAKKELAAARTKAPADAQACAAEGAALAPAFAGVTEVSTNGLSIYSRHPRLMPSSPRTRGPIRRTEQNGPPHSRW